MGNSSGSLRSHIFHGRLRIAAWFMLVALTSTTMFVTTTSPAAAAERSGDYLTSVELTRSPDKDKTTPLTAGEKVSFAFKWDASSFNGTDRAPEQGDTMTVALPSWARFKPLTVQMKDDAGNVIANCVQTATNVTCTFTEYVNGKVDLKGGYNSSMELVKTAVITDVVTQVGPVGVNIDLNSIANPDVIGNGVVGAAGPGPATLSPLQFTTAKSGAFAGIQSYAGGKAVLSWNIQAPGTGSAITITDSFTAGQVRVEYLDSKPNYKKSVQVRYRDSAEEGDAGGYWNLVTDGVPGTAKLLSQSEYDVVWNAAENEVRVTLLSTSTTRVYRVNVLTQVEPDGLQDGDVVNNVASVGGKEVSATTQARNMVSAYASGRDGFGSAYVFKVVKGVDAVSSDYAVKINAHIVFPSGTVEDRVLDVTPGTDLSKAGQLKDLPAGTKVTLTEATPTQVPGYELTGLVFGEGKQGDLMPNPTSSSRKTRPRSR